jgi:hypothetical protein
MDERSNKYEEANDRPTDMKSITECLDVLQRKGFADQFRIEEGAMVSTADGSKYSPGDVIAVNFFRFEGITDPDDTSILYAIETVDGKKGTLIDAYGLYSDPEVSDFVKEMEIHKKISTK